MDGQFFPGQAIQFDGGPRGRPFIDAGAYRANAVAFDGTNDYLLRGAGLTGAADSKLLTASVWLKKGVDGVNVRILSSPDTASFLQFYVTSGNVLTFAAEDPADTGNVIRATSASYLVASGWTHIVLSFDLSDTGKRHLYRNDSSSVSWPTYTDADMDLTATDWAVGSIVSGGQKAAMDLADLQVWFGVYVDLSVEANRRLFISASGKPVSPALARASLGEPTILLHGIGSGYRQWHENKGSGGGFTLNGALADASSSPSD